MARIAYVNGSYVPLSEAVVNIEDRGYQFSDGIYEVCLVVDGRWWDLEGHLARMERSLDELSIPRPMNSAVVKIVMGKLLRKNRLDTALIYLQITRGVSPRNHPFPSQVAPTLVLTARPFPFATLDAAARLGVDVITQPDIRWGRVDIKSISLLPNVLAKQAAREAEAVEAILLDNTVVTEGSSSNIWMVNAEGQLITHPLGNQILGGITRQSVMECARELQMTVIEKPFSLEEALNAAELFMTSATSLVTPINRVNENSIANGAPGPIALKLRDSYIDKNRANAVSD